MLRLTHSLDLAFRQNESRFSIDLWKGLGYALVFHFLLFALFRIATLPNLDIIKPLTPVHVEIDLGNHDAEVYFSSSHKEPFFTDFIPPPTLDRLISCHIELMDQYTFNKAITTSWPDFSELETIDYIPAENFP